MSPLVDNRLTVPETSVADAVLVMVPAPLDVTLIVPPVFVETLALIATLVLPVSVDSEIMPLPLMDSALEIVSPLPETIVMLPDVSTIGPRVTVPEALMVRLFVPSVIVWPDEENVPPLLNSML